jgi:anaphase-promoting complex subunit 3
VFPDDAAILCRTGSMAMKGNLPEQAAPCFRRALEINPFIWEAFESLCTMGVYAMLSQDEPRVMLIC